MYVVGLKEKEKNVYKINWRQEMFKNVYPFGCIFHSSDESLDNIL